MVPLSIDLQKKSGVEKMYVLVEGTSIRWTSVYNEQIIWPDIDKFSYVRFLRFVTQPLGIIDGPSVKYL